MQVEGVLPGAVGQLDQVAERTPGDVVGVADADVVDQDIDRAELDQRLLDEPIRALGGREVDPDRDGAGRLELRRYRARSGDDPHALGAEDANDLEADSPTAAGDERVLAIQLQIHVFSFI
jgi:hypothetical protein